MSDVGETPTPNTSAAKEIQESGNVENSAIRKTKPMKRRSDVWNHFTQNDKKNPDLARCNYCDKEFWANSSSVICQTVVYGSGNEDYSGLCLDVATRWNSTYLMLNAAVICQTAFERYEEMDVSFRNESDVGEMPYGEDWIIATALCTFLRRFYKLTLFVSGTLYVTSNSFLEQICNVGCFMMKSQNRDDEMGAMSKRMKDKYDKYWGNFEKMNIFIFIPVVLDPRYKLEGVKVALSQMFIERSCDALALKVEEVMKSLFEEYQKVHVGNVSGSSRGVEERMMYTTSHDVDDEDNFLQSKLKRMRMASQSELGFNELEKYLNETPEPIVDKFDILVFWKVNSARFPVLSKMARDVLAIPISTVASESVFSTGGRVLDCFRSSLQPKTVETLICTQNWLRASLHVPMVGIEEDIADSERLEKEMREVETQAQPSLNSS